mmetsp:Transcript_19394/g.56731  ORF Transcript_19394/g.56731 Transcript_19394/m.56731 type:complete len:318 (-) Transcript_19394:321-1274(-)
MWKDGEPTEPPPCSKETSSLPRPSSSRVYMETPKGLDAGILSGDFGVRHVVKPYVDRTSAAHLPELIRDRILLTRKEERRRSLPALDPVRRHERVQRRRLDLLQERRGPRPAPRRRRRRRGPRDDDARLRFLPPGRSDDLPHDLGAVKVGRIDSLLPPRQRDELGRQKRPRPRGGQQARQFVRSREGHVDDRVRSHRRSDDLPDVVLPIGNHGSAGPAASAASSSSSGDEPRSVPQRAVRSDLPPRGGERRVSAEQLRPARSPDVGRDRIDRPHPGEPRGIINVAPLQTVRGGGQHVLRHATLEESVLEIIIRGGRR